MILIGNLLILLPPKTGTTTICHGLGAVEGLPLLKTSYKHGPLAEYGLAEKFRNCPPVSELDVVMVSRRPEDRAMSLCRWAAKLSRTFRPRFTDPSQAILEGPFFDWEFMEEQLPVWREFAGPVCDYFTHALTPKSVTVFRLEDQLDDLADLVAEWGYGRPSFGHENVSRYELSADQLSPQARAKLLQEWGEEDWDLWGYDKP